MGWIYTRPIYQTVLHFSPLIVGSCYAEGYMAKMGGGGGLKGTVALDGFRQLVLSRMTKCEFMVFGFEIMPESILRITRECQEH
jgi:hypothetical protein